MPDFQDERGEPFFLVSPSDREKLALGCGNLVAGSIDKPVAQIRVAFQQPVQDFPRNPPNPAGRHGFGGDAPDLILSAQSDEIAGETKPDDLSTPVPQRLAEHHDAAFNEEYFVCALPVLNEDGAGRQIQQLALVCKQFVDFRSRHDARRRPVPELVMKSSLGHARLLYPL
jgi:hypothetical protein